MLCLVGPERSRIRVSEEAWGGSLHRSLCPGVSGHCVAQDSQKESCIRTQVRPFTFTFNAKDTFPCCQKSIAKHYKLRVAQVLLPIITPTPYITLLLLHFQVLRTWPRPQLEQRQAQPPEPELSSRQLRQKS